MNIASCPPIGSRVFLNPSLISPKSFLSFLAYHFDATYQQ